MGGLWKYMPITHITFLVACLAIAGIPPFSGFFSKDEILTACFEFSPVMGGVMTFIAGLTAFYMFRLFYNIFWSRKYEVHHDSEHAPVDVHGHHGTPHEAPLTMTIPLIFLALVTLVAGRIPFGEFVSSNGEAYHIHLNWAVAGTSIGVAVIGIAIATAMYLKGNQTVANKLSTTFGGFYKAAYKRFYIDEVYQFITHKIIFNYISTPLAWFDRHVVDGFMNSLAWVSNTTGEKIRSLQSGSIQLYTMIFLAGALIFTLLLLFLN
jgi:NADH-quinone oxidoreductase subunit L